MKRRSNGWSKYEKMVLDKLDSLGKGQGELRKEVTDARVEIGELKVKAGVWGFAAGAIPAISAILTYLLVKK